MESNKINALKKSNQISHQLTKEAIQDALFLLMSKKRFQDINVTEIINKSGVSRSAFYKNYKSKEEIIEDRLNQLLTDGIQILNYSNSLKDKAAFIYYIVSQNKDKFKLLLDSGLEEELLKRANSITITENMSFHQKMYTLLWNGAIYNFFIEWIRYDEFGTLEELMEFCDYVSQIVALPDVI